MRKSKAQTILEYGLIITVLAFTIVFVLNKFGTTTSKIGNFSNNAVSVDNDNAVTWYCQKVHKNYDQGTGACK